jgi:hypothetical protein
VIRCKHTGFEKEEDGEQPQKSLKEEEMQIAHKSLVVVLLGP